MSIVLALTPFVYLKGADRDFSHLYLIRLPDSRDSIWLLFHLMHMHTS